MGKNLSQLSQLKSLTGSEKVYVLNGTDDRAATINQIKDYIAKSGAASDYIALKGDDGETYRAYVKNGELYVEKEKGFTGATPKSGDNVNYDGLIINHMYGTGSDVSVSTPVSHSFVELYNFRDDYELNLNGLYLWYRAKSGNWEKLALKGTIPPKHSFLIRGKQHMDPYDVEVTLPILDYDMQWDIDFSNQGFSMYLCIGDTTPDDNPVRQLKDSSGNVSFTNGYYIDLLAGGGKEDSETVWAYETRYLHCMDKNTGLHRVDFANAGKKNIGSNALVKGNNEADCEPIDYTKCDTSVYRPRSLKDGRWTEFYDKPQIALTSPSMINISFGEKGDTVRCFCFHTKVTNQGYVYYKRQSDSTWNVVNTDIQIVKDQDGQSSVHKCKIENLSTGVYEYKVGYPGCWSDVNTFEVKDYNQSNSEINMLWTTDQQSWNVKEYSVWQIVAKHLRNNNGYKKYDFHLNTGDISQNAERVSNY